MSKEAHYIHTMTYPMLVAAETGKRNLLRTNINCYMFRRCVGGAKGCAMLGRTDKDELDRAVSGQGVQQGSCQRHVQHAHLVHQHGQVLAAALQRLRRIVHKGALLITHALRTHSSHR